MPLKTVDDFVRIAAAGGGLSLDGNEFSVDELVRIAAAGRGHCSYLSIYNGILLSTDDCVRIAAAGRPNVRFEL